MADGLSRQIDADDAARQMKGNVFRVVRKRTADPGFCKIPQRNAIGRTAVRKGSFGRECNISFIDAFLNQNAAAFFAESDHAACVEVRADGQVIDGVVACLEGSG